jgi:hypothetical protein
MPHHQGALRCRPPAQAAHNARDRGASCPGYGAAFGMGGGRASTAPRRGGLRVRVALDQPGANGPHARLHRTQPRACVWLWAHRRACQWQRAAEPESAARLNARHCQLGLGAGPGLGVILPLLPSRDLPVDQWTFKVQVDRSCQCKNRRLSLGIKVRRAEPASAP